MPKKEKSVVNKLRYMLAKAGAKTIKTSGEGEPDIIGVWKGVAFAIECKQPGERPAELQLFRLEEWAAAGAVSFWSANADEAYEELDNRVGERLFRHE